MEEYYRFIGLFLILIGWIYTTYRAIVGLKKPMHLPFSILYGLGSFLLFLHSLVLNDLVFMVLNFFATLMPIINIFLLFSRKN